ncbi:MAG: glycosyltransferase [Deltaproteobacteria bacterium]|nr:glycosyltransferase [Deltaproteobacteria bacterium]
MKTSIIICFYERLQHLRFCLDSLKNCAGDFDEVVIADDGSGESCVRQLKKMISNYDFSIIHAWQPDEGFRAAAARNNAIRHTSGNYLIFLDCDFVVLPGTIKSHLDAAKPGRFVGGFCKYLNEEQTNIIFQKGVSDKLLEDIYQSLPEEPIIKDHRRFVRHRFFLKLGLASVRKQRLSSHFSIYRKDMEYINGYDENFVGWGGEDEDLAIRFAEAGLEGKSIMREARIFHLWHPKELGDKHWKEGSNVEYLKRKDIPFFCENGLVKKN